MKHLKQKTAKRRAGWPEQERRLCALLSLKQYERPAPDVARRCRAGILRQLATRDRADTAAPWSTFWADSFPAFRFGMAALLMALLGLHMLSASSLVPVVGSPRLLAEQWEEASAFVSGDQLAQEERPNPEFSAMMMSNWSPRLQRGGSYQFIGLGNR